MSALGTQPLPASYQTYRAIRKHPTVAMARALSAAPILAGKWSTKAKDGVPDEMVMLIQDEIIAKRREYLRAAGFGRIDFGWVSFEKVLKVRTDGFWGLEKLKPLLQDMTTIVVDQYGRKIGVKQRITQEIFLGMDQCVILSFDVEGTDWYGNSLLENARLTWNDWMEANEGAKRYDAKQAGALFVVHYPSGETEDESGTLRPNTELASEMLVTMQSSGGLTIPGQIQQTPDGEEQAWRIEILSDASGQQPTFIARLDYLDKMLCRALLQPERSILEGQNGTRAESEVQGDLAILNAQQTNEDVVDGLNKQVVGPLLAVNYGEEYRDAVEIEAAPLVDDKLSFLKEVYRTILAIPDGGLAESSAIDMDALKDRIGIPKASEVDDSSEQIIPGVDANNPAAATIRRIYSELGVDANGESA
jgi:hypothetical protein